MIIHPYWRAPTHPIRPQRSPRPPPPTPPHRRPSGASKEIQIAHNQRTVKLSPQVRPPTQTVTSCWRPFWEGVMATQNMSSQPKNHPRSWPTRQTLQGTSANCRRCTRYRKERLTPLNDQQCFSPTLKSSKCWSSPTPILTHPKASKTTEQHRWSTPSHICLTNPRKTPQSPHPNLRHAPVLRPETPLSKRAQETSRTSAS